MHSFDEPFPSIELSRKLLLILSFLLMGTILISAHGYTPAHFLPSLWNLSLAAALVHLAEFI